jgi:hypothetical protein
MLKSNYQTIKLIQSIGAVLKLLILAVISDICLATRITKLISLVNAKINLIKRVNAIRRYKAFKAQHIHSGNILKQIRANNYTKSTTKNIRITTTDSKPILIATADFSILDNTIAPAKQRKPRNKPKTVAEYQAINNSNMSIVSHTIKQSSVSGNNNLTL